MAEEILNKGAMNMGPKLTLNVTNADGSKEEKVIEGKDVTADSIEKTLNAVITKAKQGGTYLCLSYEGPGRQVKVDR